MLATGNTNNDGVRWHLAVVAQQPEPAGHVRPQRRPRARRVGLGRRLARLARRPRRRPSRTRWSARRRRSRSSPSPPRPRPTRRNNQNRPVTPVSTQTGADTVNGWINGLTAGGSTNWDRGIDQVAESGTRFDVAIVITDGNPTVYGNRPGAGQLHPPPRGRERHLLGQRGEGRRRPGSIAFGVGAGVSGSPNNLDLDLRPDRQQRLLPDHRLHAGRRGAAGARPRQLPGHHLGRQAGRAEHGARRVRSPARCRPAAGSSAPRRRRAASPSPRRPARRRRPAARSTSTSTFPGGTTTAPVTVTETQQAGYTLVQQGGLNATCRRLDTNAAVTVTNSGATGFVVTAATAFPVSCTVYNRAPHPPRPSSSTRSGSSTVRASTRARNRPASTPRSPSAARRRAGVWCAPASSRATSTVAERDRQPPRTAVHADEQPASRWPTAPPCRRRAAVHGHAGRAARTPTPSPTPSPATRG